MPPEKLHWERGKSANPDPWIYVLKRRAGHVQHACIRDAFALGNAAATIIDLTAVSHVDSVGLGPLVIYCVSGMEHRSKTVLVGSNEHVRTLFKLSKVERFFEIFPTLDSATKAAKT